MYSATFNDDILTKTKQFIGAINAFTCPKESLKLQGVKNFKLLMQESEKIDFVAQLHTNLEKAMTMIFVNRKDSATALQNKLKSQNIKANILIGGLDNT